MKRTRSSTGEKTVVLPIGRPVYPAIPGFAEAVANQAPGTTTTTAEAESTAPGLAAMVFPGPFAYVPRPPAMQGKGTQPGSAATASSPQRGLEPPATMPVFAALEDQPPVASADAPARASAPAGAMAAGASTAAVADNDNPHGYPPLLLASSQGKLAALEVLLQDPALDINQIDQKFGGSALMVEADAAVLAWLIAAGAEPDLGNAITGMSALMAAVVKNKPEAVACLLAAGANANLAHGPQQHTVLMAAAGLGHVDVLKMLLAHQGIAVDQTNARGATALSLAARFNKAEAVACLLAAGAKVHLPPGQKHENALIAAATKGHVDVLRMLLAQKGVAVDQTDADGRSALWMAAFFNKPEAVACLLAGGANVNLANGKRLETALIAAASMGHADVVKTLLAHKGTAVNQTDVDGWDALFGASHRNEPEVVACLLAAGANASPAIVKPLKTPLTTAASLGNVKVVKTLLAHKGSAAEPSDADKNVALQWAIFGAIFQNEMEPRMQEAVARATPSRHLDGHDPVKHAVERRNAAMVEVVACLLEAGASTTPSRHLDGYDPVKQAMELRSAALMEVLLAHGAVLNVFHFDRAHAAFSVTVPDLLADRKAAVNPAQIVPGLVAPAFIDGLIKALETGQELLTFLVPKTLRVACALPVVECLSKLNDTWPLLANRERAPNLHQKRLLCAAALNRLSVVTAQDKALEHYKAAGISAAGVERLSKVATQQIEKIITFSERVLTHLGSAMLDKLVQGFMASINSTQPWHAEALNASLINLGWLAPVAQAIGTAWKSALDALQREPASLPAGTAVEQVPQGPSGHIERRAPRLFAQALQRELAAPTLLAALRTWIGAAGSSENLHLLFQIQCDWLRQYCGQVESAE